MLVGPFFCAGPEGFHAGRITQSFAPSKALEKGLTGAAKRIKTGMAGPDPFVCQVGKFAQILCTNNMLRYGFAGSF